MSILQIPNIFIKEVNLFDNTEQKFRVKIKTLINNDNNWANDKVSEYMRVLVVISSDVELNNRITSGQIIFDKDLLIKEYNENEKVNIFYKTALSRNKYELQEEAYFIDSYQTDIATNTSELKVFCSVYFEMPQLFENLNLDYNKNEKRYGSICSDTIIELGNVNTTATVFVLPNGSQYSGPVHYHPKKGYMVGAKHTKKSHDILNTVEVANFKIKDFRKNLFQKPQNIGKNTVSSFSNLNYSIDSKGHSTGFFSINFKNLVLYQTKYGFFIRTLSDKAIADNIDNIKIKNFEIIRKRMDQEESIFMGRTSAAYKGSPLLSINNDHLELDEILTENKDVKTFYFKDKTISKGTLGTYQYQLKLSFSDPTISFISEAISGLRQSKKQMKEYYQMINKDKNYNYDLDIIEARVYNSEFDGFNTTTSTPPEWATASERFIRANSYLYNITENQKSQLKSSVSSKIDPRNATLFSLASFNEEFNVLLNTFEASFDISNDNTQFGSKRAFVKTPNSKNTIIMDHTFTEAYQPRNYFISYDYMDFDNNSDSKILSTTIIKKRMKNEFDKFFTSSPTSFDISSVPGSYNYLLNLQENYYSYLSPRTMVLGQEKVNLKNIDEILISEINKIFNPSYENNIYFFTSVKSKNIENVSEEMSRPSAKEEDK